MSGPSSTSRVHGTEWRLGAAILIVALAIGIIVQSSIVGGAIDRLIDPVRNQLLSHRASGRIAIVEMDAASTAAIQRWPWPRDNYAQAIDNLRRAGAASIVFDVDLGSSGTADGDQAMARALARADGLVALPTFGQQARSGDQRMLDAMPLPLFRRHVALASVSVRPDEDGLVRHIPLGTMNYGVPHPSLAAYIAHRSGRADQLFPVDFSILADTIPRLSFVAVRDGRFDPAMVRGRNILIGATAIEMGDRYPTPRWANLPGVVIQALAAETLFAGIPDEAGGTIPIAFALLLAVPIVMARRGATIALAGIAGLIAIVGVALVLQRHGLYVPVSGALMVLVVTMLGDGARAVAGRFQLQRIIDEESGLPNRHALLTGTPARADQDALMVMSVSNYDTVAAVLPEGGGAQLMKRLAERIGVICVDQTVYRIGHSSLALRVDPEDPVALVHLLRPVLLRPIEVAGRRLDASVVFGIALDEHDIDKCVHAALLAAEQAARGGLAWKMATTDLTDVEQGVSLLGELDEALDSGGVLVHYQPKLTLGTGTISGAEALVRWRNAEGSFISPATFIPLAEAANRIAPLTMFVLRTVLDDLARWRAAGHDLVIAVNISARLLGHAEFDEAVDAILAASPVPPAALTFEVTESAALEDMGGAMRSLHRFSALGIAISMDDYGTGQSTLSYLRKLPLAELKIDQSFVKNATHDRREAAMVRSTVDLAHELGLKVVAEGVEDEPCMAYLRSIGCDVAQGYLIGKPQPATSFIACVEQHRAVLAAGQPIAS